MKKTINALDYAGEICKANGADVLVAGSAFYGNADRPGFVKAIEA